MISFIINFLTSAAQTFLSLKTKRAQCYYFNTNRYKDS